MCRTSFRLCRLPKLKSNCLSVSDLEKSYEDNQHILEVKAEQLVELEAAVKELLQDISHKVSVYSSCLF